MSPLVPYTEKGRNFSDLSESKQGLLYAVDNTIRLHATVGRKAKEYLIAERPGLVSALAISEGSVFHAENLGIPDQGQPKGRIFNTETGDEVATRSDNVISLTEYNGRLVDGGDYINILYTETGEPIAYRSERVRALVTRGGELIDCSGRTVRSTLNDEILHEQVPFYSIIAEGENGSNPVRQFYEPSITSPMVVYKNRLILAESYFVRNGDEKLGSNRYYSAIIDFEGYRQLARRPDWTRALAVYNGRLVDGGDYPGIFYTESGKELGRAGDSVAALLPVSQEMADRLLELPGVIPLK
jgi:hypothetical protein